MIKEIISGREEDASIFMSCMCGKEIIQIAYYKEDAILHKIIYLKYFGQIENNEDLVHNMFTFTENSFCNFVNKLEEFIDSKGPRTIYINHYEDILQLSKDIDGFYIISNSKNLQDAQEKNYIWDIVFRDPESKEFLFKLKEIKKQILDNSLSISYNNEDKKIIDNMSDINDIVNYSTY